VGHFGLGEENTYLYYLTESLSDGLGVLVEVLAIIGLVFVIKGFGRKNLLFISFPLIFFLITGSWKFHAHRYMVPVITFLSVLAAFATLELMQKTFKLKPKAVKVIALVVGLLVIPNFISIAKFKNLAFEVDTRTAAKEWVEKNIPQQSFIVMEAYGPPLDKSSYEIILIPFNSLHPELSEPFYDLRWYDDVTHIVTSSFIYDRYYKSPDKFKDQINFYETLNYQYELIKELPSNVKSHPTIKIYKNPREGHPFTSLTLSPYFTPAFPEDLYEKLKKNKLTLYFLDRLSKIYLKGKLIHKAANVLQGALKVFPETDELHLQLGMLYNELRQFDDALYVLNNVKSDDDKIEAVVKYHTGYAYFKKRQYSEAIKEFEDALRLKADLYRAMFYLGILFEDAGMKDKAAASYEQFMKTAPAQFQQEIQLAKEGLERVKG